MKILIVDDERLARERLRALLNELGGYEIIGEACNGREAVSIAKSQQPDVVLLDIRMPSMDGMSAAEILSTLHPAPAIIFITAYGDHALEAFEKQAVDYLLKPIRKERLSQSLKRAYALLHPQVEHQEAPQDSARSHITANVRGELRLIPLNKIFYFLADEKYVALFWKEGQVLINEPLKDLEIEFAGQFLRIHRSTLVAIIHIVSLVKNRDGQHFVKLKESDKLLEISRRHLPTVRKILRDMHLPEL